LALSNVSGYTSVTLWRKSGTAWTAESLDVGYSATNIALSQDGKTAIISGGPEGIDVWSLEPKGVRRMILPDSGFNVDATFVAGGKMIMGNNGSGILRLWDAQTGRPLLPLPSLAQTPVALAACNGSIIAVSDGLGLNLLDADRREMIGKIPYAYVSPHGMALSADGKRLLVADHDRHVFTFDFSVPSQLRGGVDGKSPADQARWFAAAGVFAGREDVKKPE
jgi:hypothetical protein